VELTVSHLVLSRLLLEGLKAWIAEPLRITKRSKRYGGWGRRFYDRLLSHDRPPTNWRERPIIEKGEE